VIIGHFLTIDILIGVAINLKYSSRALEGFNIHNVNYFLSLVVLFAYLTLAGLLFKESRDLMKKANKITEIEHRLVKDQEIEFQRNSSYKGTSLVKRFIHISSLLRVHGTKSTKTRCKSKQLANNWTFLLEDLDLKKELKLNSESVERESPFQNPQKVEIGSLSDRESILKSNLQGSNGGNNSFKSRIRVRTATKYAREMKKSQRRRPRSVSSNLNSKEESKRTKKEKSKKSKYRNVKHSSQE
jgi:hypothetical protein